MANVGDFLDVPENGMIRFEDNNPLIGFAGLWNTQSSSDASGNSFKYISTTATTNIAKQSSVNVSIYTDKIYICFAMANIYSDNIVIKIDGNTFNASAKNLNYSSAMGKILAFYIEDLELKYHDVSIYCTDGARWAFDCIDGCEGAILRPATGSIVTSTYEGMKRMPSQYTEIAYFGTYVATSATPSIKYTDTIGDKFEFYFYGTSFYIIDDKYNNRSDSIICTVDDNDEYIVSEYGVFAYNYLVLSVYDLAAGVHKVTVENNSLTSNTRMGLQNIDIDGCMCTSDGKYIDVTPIMTSSSAPSPYKVTQSSYYKAAYAGYKAFNGTDIDYTDTWVTTAGSNGGWLQLDFEEKTKVNAIFIRPRQYVGNPQLTDDTAPKEFQILGSDDGITYSTILEATDVTNWLECTNKIFVTNNTHNYRFYKLNVSLINNEDYVAISELRFLMRVDTPFFLLNDGETYKRIDYENNCLETVDSINSLKANIFENDCICNINDIVPYLNELSSDYRGLVCNRDVNLIVNGLVTTNEMIVMNNDFFTSNAETINSLSINSVKSENSSIKIIFSFDSGITWKTYSDGSWTELDIEIPKTNYNEMSIEEKNSWDEACNEILANGILDENLCDIDFNIEGLYKLRCAIVLSKTDMNDNCELNNLNWNIDENNILSEVCSNDIEKQIIKNTIILKSNISADKIYVNITTCGTESTNIDFNALTENDIEILKEKLGL